MGFGQHNDGARFINVSNGKMHYKDGDEKRTADWYEGMLQRVEFIEDEYQGSITQKVVLTMQDDKSETVKLKFTLEGWYSYGFFARIASVDLTQPFRLGVFGSEDNTKVSFCYIRQGDKKIESDKTYPKPVKAKVGTKEVVDWSAFLERVKLTMAQLDKSSGQKHDDLPF